ncbi:hypothetical protein BDA96_05G212300 [Sorghum bicolor]|uniref:Knottins-like domain-containing protein n=2 Tax=Sorghum bicolor TaxID=4558 RepID=A0A1B6PTK8_SORBI|nr:hypothetical protein BDA96_05G212300 [Sorghum bicolor]KXG29000.1 hypothetical protein SORBI_3005G196400 [Sorghum bicolor]
MAPSRRTLFATAAIVLVLIIVVTEMSSVGAGGALCRHLSSGFTGVCGFDTDCRTQCLSESHDNLGGACDGFPAKCYCVKPCLP